MPRTRIRLRRGTHVGLLVALCVTGLLFAATPAMAEEPSSTATSTISTDTVPAPLIVIDPGHGGRYSNANANGLKEKNVNLSIALYLREALEARGYRVLMTRTTDRAVMLSDIPTWNWSSRRDLWTYAKDHDTGYSPSIPEDDLQARVDIANRAGADLFISVHANGVYSRSARGYETFSSSRDALGLGVRSIVQRSVIRTTHLRDRGAKTADFYVLRWSNMPSFLLESAFISNVYDARLLKQAWFRRRLARSVAAGVDSWFGSNPYRRVYSRISATNTADFASVVAESGATSPTAAAVIIRGDAWADSPGVSALAASLNAPLLITGESGPSSRTAAALSKIRPQTLVFVGVTDAFDSTTTAAAASAAGLDESAATSVCAQSPAELSVAIASRIGVGASRVVLIADSADTSSALAAAPIAATLKTPLLLTQDGSLTASARAFVDAHRASISRVVLVGSTSRLPSLAASGLPSVRYSVSTVELLGNAMNGALLTKCSRPIVADPRLGAEYLVSATRAGRAGQPVIAISGKVLIPQTRAWISNRRTSIGSFEVHNPDGNVPHLVDAMLRKADYY